MTGGEKGATLVEALVALVILGVALAGILPSFTTQLHSNARCEQRSGAVSAAQQVLDALRLEDPAAMPMIGTSAPQLIMVGELQYEVITRYCADNTYCNTESRHLIVEVQRDGRTIYDVETIYTQLR